MLIILLWLFFYFTEEIWSSHKAPKRYYKNIPSKGYTKNSSKEILAVDSALNTNPQTHKI